MCYAVIEAQQVTKHFGDRLAVDGLSISVPGCVVYRSSLAPRSGELPEY